MRVYLLALVCLAFGLPLVGCAPAPDLPTRRVAEVAVGNPSETDTECTSTRWPGGMCDIVVAFDDMPVNGLLFPGSVYALDGSVISGEVPPTVYERGFRAGSTGVAARRTLRIWAYDLWATWGRVCGGTTGPCGFVAAYTQASGMYPGSLSVGLSRRETGGTIGFESAYYRENDEVREIPDAFAVAYDTATGSYGITPMARRMGVHGATEEVLGYRLPDAGGGLFSATYPTWTAD